MADSGREAVMRLPVDRYGGITPKGYTTIRARFYDGAEQKQHGLKYAVCLEAFSTGKDLQEAIKSYYKNEI